MCKICEAKRLSVCFESDNGMHYGYCGGFSSSSVGHFAIKVKTDKKGENKFIRFKFCPMCGKKLDEKEAK